MPELDDLKKEFTEKRPAGAKFLRPKDAATLVIIASLVRPNRLRLLSPRHPIRPRQRRRLPKRVTVTPGRMRAKTEASNRAPTIVVAKVVVTAGQRETTPIGRAASVTIATTGLATDAAARSSAVRRK